MSDLTEARAAIRNSTLWQETWNLFCSRWLFLLSVAFCRHTWPLLIAAALALIAHRLEFVGLCLALLALVICAMHSYNGYLWVIVELCRNKQASFSDFLLRKPSTKFMVTLLTVLAVSLLGSILLIVPGVFLFCRLCFAPLIVLDKRAGIIESIKQSFGMTRGITGLIAIYLVCMLLLESILHCGLLTGTLLSIAIAWLYTRKTEDSDSVRTSPQCSTAKSAAILVLSASTSTVMALIMLMGVRCFGESRYIPSTTMQPTLEVGNRLIVEKSASYGLDTYRQGDIIVFYPPPSELDGHDLSYDPLHILGRATGLPFFPYETAYIKRIAGLPGDRIVIKKGVGVFINDRMLPNAATGCEKPDYELDTIGDMGDRTPNGQIMKVYPDVPADSPIVVPAGHVFVLGDNVNHSIDSHRFGFIDQKRIVGRAWCKYHPEFHFL